MKKSYFLLSISLFLFVGCATKENNLINKKEEVIFIKSKDEKKDKILPKNVKSGECYKKVLIPAIYKDIPKKVVVKKRFYKTITKKVLLKKGYYKEIKMPDKYRYRRVKRIKYKIISTPSGERKIAIPIYKVIKEKIADGEIKKIKIPPIYKRVPIRVPYEKEITKIKYQRKLIEPERIELKRVVCPKNTKRLNN